MAKIKVRPHPGALSYLLKKKGMTQMDASAKTRVDRKTLLKIERGEEVKLETLQQAATKLQVTEDYFLHPPPVEVVYDDDAHSALEPGNIMLRKLDSARLDAILKGAARIRWELNARVQHEAARKSLEEFEELVEQFRQQLTQPTSGNADDASTDSLRFQLRRLKTAEDLTARLDRLAEHRLTVLGADYLFWQSSSEDDHYEDRYRVIVNYTSTRTVLLSVEPSSTPSRRVQVSLGSVPPKYAPHPFDEEGNWSRVQKTIFVNGLELTIEGDGEDI
jgi:transcriptional regulator with XRE-family HTH domain